MVLFSNDFRNAAFSSLGYRPSQVWFISTGVTSSRCLAASAVKFAMLAPKQYSAIIAIFCLHTRMCLVSHASSRKRQITEKFKGHHRISGPQNGTCFQRQKSRGGCHIYGKFVRPWMKRRASGRGPICTFIWRNDENNDNHNLG
jgi:hypothetical protein